MPLHAAFFNLDLAAVRAAVENRLGHPRSFGTHDFFINIIIIRFWCFLLRSEHRYLTLGMQHASDYTASTRVSALTFARRLYRSGRQCSGNTLLNFVPSG